MVEQMWSELKKKTKVCAKQKDLHNTPSYLLCTFFLPAMSILLFGSDRAACGEECVWVWVDSSSADAT